MTAGIIAAASRELPSIGDAPAGVGCAGVNIEVAAGIGDAVADKGAGFASMTVVVDSEPGEVTATTAGVDAAEVETRASADPLAAGGRETDGVETNRW